MTKKFAKELITPVLPRKVNAQTEHFWGLFPVWATPNATHTLLEVIHSSNREHRHELKADAEQGYYSYLWSLAIPDDKNIPDDFDELLKYSVKGTLIWGFQRKGGIFNHKDLSLVVEKILPFIKKLEEINLANESYKEVK